MMGREPVQVDLDGVIDRLYSLAAALLGKGEAAERLVERLFADRLAEINDLNTDQLEVELVRAFYRQTSWSAAHPATEDPHPKSDVWLALRSLPRDAVIPLLLIDLLGWGYARVAQTLEVEMAQLQSTLFHTRKKLRTLLLHRRD